MYVVTGGAGFIGSALVWALNQQGIDNILIVDHLSTSEKWKNLRALNYAEYMEKGEFIERIRQEALPDTINSVIHMGACSSTTEGDASYLLENNYKYSEIVAGYCLENHIRMIYASSAATYGDGRQGYRDGTECLGRLRPLNMYGYSKQLFDLWACRNDLFEKIVGLKFSNVYGPNESHKGHMRSMVHRSWEQVKSDGQVRLFRSYRDEYADGEQMRDFIYIKDVVKVILFFLDNPEISGLYNCGSGKARSFLDLAKATFAAMAREENISFRETPENIRKHYQYFTEANMAKIREAGYENNGVSLEEGVARYVRDYLMKEDRFR